MLGFLRNVDFLYVMGNCGGALSNGGARSDLFFKEVTLHTI